MRSVTTKAAGIKQSFRVRCYCESRIHQTPSTTILLRCYLRHEVPGRLSVGKRRDCPMTRDCTICGKVMYQSHNFSDWWLCRPCKTSVGYYEFPTATEVEYKRTGENIKKVPHGCLLILKDTCIEYKGNVLCPRCGSKTLPIWLLCKNPHLPHLDSILSHTCENCHFRWYNDKDGILYVRYRHRNWLELWGVLLVFDESELCNVQSVIEIPSQQQDSLLTDSKDALDPQPEPEDVVIVHSGGVLISKVWSIFGCMICL